MLEKKVTFPDLISHDSHFIIMFPFHQPVGFAGSHGGQFEEPQPPGASTQQADTIRSFPVGGPDTPGQPCTTQQPLEV